MINLGNDWTQILSGEFSSEYYLKLREFLKREYLTYKIYPHMNDIYNALRYTPYSKVKAVILGQDPYHGAGQAHGLCFSVKKGIAKPPSLNNIFKELNSDLGLPIPNHGELTSWAESGVLLLNTSLTVREGMANSHQNMGWEILTDRMISILNAREKPVVFILWGKNARLKAKLVTNNRHFILESAHPSPLSAHNGFFGNRHFSKTNEFLNANGIEPVEWRIESL